MTHEQSTSTLNESMLKDLAAAQAFLMSTSLFIS
jgi:hypothetical protein